jgi:hypothetical protein
MAPACAWRRLILLREWWKVGRRQGVMHPQGLREGMHVVQARQMAGQQLDVAPDVLNFIPVAL